jgi:VanZ family protein
MTIVLRRTLYWAPVVVYAGLIFFGSSMSDPKEHVPLEVWDKLAHAVEYGVLSVLAYRALRYAGTPWTAHHALLLAIVLASLYGCTDELHQSFVPNRTSDVHDLVADTIGAACAALLWKYVVGSMWVGRRQPLNPSPLLNEEPG